MDFRLYSRVLWRFKRIVAVGFVVAAVLAVLSVVRVGSDGVSFRDPVLWSSTTRIGVTQKGFPWGRLLAQEPTLGDTTQNLGIPQADPNRLNTLAVLYAELATSDPVRGLMRRAGAAPPLCDREAYAGTFLDAGASRQCGRIIATPVVVGDNRVALPLVDLVAIAPSPAAAVRLAQRSADAFATYIRRQQQANNVPANDRVIVQQLVRPKPPKVFRPRPKTLPIVIFLAVMFATVGLVFLLENLEPRRQEIDAEPDDVSDGSEERPVRRSAWA